VGVDERLKEGLSRIPPADPAGAYERVIEKKLRRQFVRRVQAVTMALAVFAATAAGFVALTRTFEPDRAPISDNSTQTPTTTPTDEPSATATPEAGRDIGLPYRLCAVEHLGGIDFLGNGTPGQAWTGAPVDEAGRCSRGDDGSYVVVVDYTGDGMADDRWGPLDFCFMCRPHDRSDLDADGDDELIVMTSEGSTPTFVILMLQPANGGTFAIQPVTVAPPGNADGGLDPGQILRITTGGDEGYAGAVACEGFPGAPVLVRAWFDGPIDSTDREVHIARMRFERDGTVRVLSSQDHSTVVGDPLPFPFSTDGRACGVDFDPWA
jgi:hypothetical protein